VRLRTATPQRIKPSGADSDPPRMRLFPATVILAAALSAPDGARAEIYRWTDDQGVEHFSHELSKVPPSKRPAAVEGAHAPSAEPSRLQTYSDGGNKEWVPLASGAPASLAPAHPRVRSRGGEIRIPFVKQGTLMMVQVRLNDQVDAPFFIDTGASGVSIPHAIVRRLGIRIDADTPRVEVQTAAGIVAEPVIDLDSVEVGGARVEHLAAIVNSSMDVGLLGGTFFNNFVYEVDAAQSVITLRENDGVRGGLAEPQWRERFESVRAQIGRLAAYIDTRDTDDPRLPQLQANLAALEGQLEDLDRAATLAGVPQNWRE
jgi:clan AA aspartic protease (TIGR02281 family)